MTATATTTAITTMTAITISITIATTTVTAQLKDSGYDCYFDYDYDFEMQVTEVRVVFQNFALLSKIFLSSCGINSFFSLLGRSSAQQGTTALCL